MAFSMRGYKGAALAEQNPRADSCVSEVLDSRRVLRRTGKIPHVDPRVVRLRWWW